MSALGETLTQALTWLREGRRVALATVVEVEGSAPFEPGATMAIDGAGAVEGSVTGGCVESATAESAVDLLAGPKRLRVLRFGVSDELAGSVGLTCGGIVHIAVRRLEEDDERLLALLAEAEAANRAVATATLLDGPGAGSVLALCNGEELGAVGADPELMRHVRREIAGMLRRGTGGIRRYGADGTRLGSEEVRVFFAVRGAPPQLLIVGAVDFSAALAPLAAAIGFEVTICDARPSFTESARFSRSARVLTCWPQEAIEELALGSQDALLVCSHDPKFDEPALLAGLQTHVGYVGALGSRRTAADRHRRLAAAGATAADLERIHSPAGLDIGARDAEETAVSILAEILAVRNGRDGGPLREAEGPIHAR